MKFISLTTVYDIYHAQMLCRALEEENIPCMEANENIATILPYLQQGIQIRVKEHDYVRAKAIAERMEETRRLRCPNCESNNVVYQGSESRSMTLKESLLKMLAHVPINPHMLVYKCSDCGTTFKVD